MENNSQDILTQPVVVVNIGLRGFAKNLEEQGIQVVQVDWIPPASGDKEMMDLLDRLL